ncbi:MAG: glycosyltransferase 87 family protein [Actinomycetes bacterium]
MRRTWKLPVLLLGVWVLTRALSVLSLVKLPWVPFDVVIYSQWADGLRAGSFPMGDERWQYPDFMAVVLLVPSYLHVSYITSFVAISLCADLAIMLAVIAAWRRRNGQVMGPWVWALAGIWIGSVLLVRLDLFVTLFAVLALVTMGRPVLSAAFSALGTGLKVWPAVGLLGLRRGRLLRAFGMFVGVLVLAELLVRLMLPSGDSFLGAQAGRGLHAESLGVFPYLIRGIGGYPPTFSETHGTLELVSPWASTIGLLLTLVGLFVIAVLAWLNWSGRLAGLLPADLVTICVLVLVVTGRVFSPQFYIWLAGLCAVALINRRTILRLPTLLIIASAVCAMYVYPFDNGWRVGETDALIAQLIRLVLVVAALIVALARVNRIRVSAPTGAR